MKVIISCYIKYAAGLVAACMMGMKGEWTWFFILMTLSLLAAACAVYVTFNNEKK